MSFESAPPPWKLPEGVNESLWRYTQTPRLASDEDLYFAGHPLFQADRRVLDAHFLEPGRLIDLGCGAGRHSIHFAQRGFEVTAVELSQPMLETVGLKATAEGLAVNRVRANLCSLGCFPDDTFHYAISMFSTLGMIRGADSRRRALAEAYRILRPGGRLALHAHNVWLNLRSRQGRSWLIEQVPNYLFSRPNRGDRRMTYRGIPAMEVHLYRWSELRRDLIDARFQVDEVLPIETVSAQPIMAPWWFHTLRAGGWFVFASKRG